VDDAVFVRLAKHDEKMKAKDQKRLHNKSSGDVPTSTHKPSVTAFEIDEDSADEDASSAPSTIIPQKDFTQLVPGITV
jgi:hypothetical protein